MKHQEEGKETAAEATRTLVSGMGLCLIPRQPELQGPSALESRTLCLPLLHWVSLRSLGWPQTHSNPPALAVFIKGMQRVRTSLDQCTLRSKQDPRGEGLS